MTSAFDLCREHGFKFDRYTHGKHHTVCPRCSPGRKTPNRKKKCTRVQIDERVFHR
jgi:hypothetical protein